MKKIMKRFTALALALVIALSVMVVANPSDAEAASTKKVTAVTNYKKAPAIKTGTTKVTYKKSKGYVKFTAPKKGTYVITFSGLATVPVNQVACLFHILYQKNDMMCGAGCFIALQ
jgi:thiamine pyrophosphokinase